MKQNCANKKPQLHSSKYLGVSKENKSGKYVNKVGYIKKYDYGTVWKASICINGKQINLGRFNTKEEATHEYNTAALKYHKEYARPNQL